MTSRAHWEAPGETLDGVFIVVRRPYLVGFLARVFSSRIDCDPRSLFFHDKHSIGRIRYTVYAHHDVRDEDGAHSRSGDCCIVVRDCIGVGRRRCHFSTCRIIDKIIING